MLTDKKIRTLAFSFVCSALSFLSPGIHPAAAQSVAQSSFAATRVATAETNTSATKILPSATAADKPASTDERLNALEQALEQQNAKLDQLQNIIDEQQQTISLVAGRLD